MKMMMPMMLALLAVVSGGPSQQCMPPPWPQQLTGLHKSDELKLLLDELFVANCECVFSPRLLERFTGGDELSRPTAESVERQCTGRFEVRDLVTDSSHTIATLTVESAPGSRFEGRFVDIVLVYPRDKWLVYLPQPVNGTGVPSSPDR